MYCVCVPFLLLWSKKGGFFLKMISTPSSIQEWERPGGGKRKGICVEYNQYTDLCFVLVRKREREIERDQLGSAS